MKRRMLWIALVGVLAAACTWAQHEPAKGEKAAEHGEVEEVSPLWAWLNFALLAGGLTWIFRKNALPYFAARAVGIRKGMLEADDERAQAERRIAAVEARLAHLQADVQALRSEAMAEEKAEHERARRDTAAELEKIRRHAGQEIDAAAKTARMELKRHSAALAMELAQQKVRARMNAATQDALFRGFVQKLTGVSQ
jgi:F-type H+-transporting ATPase subunit b